MMNDCTNAEIRDQLPDLLHERLEVSARAAVQSHVDDCGDCRDELALLRDVLGMIALQERQLDVARIVQALPKPPAQVVSIASRRRVWSDWRVAAAVTLLVAGGGSYAVMRTDAPGTDSAAIAALPAATPVTSRVAIASESANVRAAASAGGQKSAVEDHAAADLGSDNRLGDLSESQLESLLKDIDKLQAVPVTEPEPVSIRVSAKVGSSETL